MSSRFDAIKEWVLANKGLFLTLARTFASSTSNKIDDKLVEFLELIFASDEGGGWFFSSLEKGAALPMAPSLSDAVSEAGFDATKSFEDAKEFIPAVSGIVKLAA